MIAFWCGIFHRKWHIRFADGQAFCPHCGCCWMVPTQQLSDAGEDLVRLAAAKDAEIAALTNERDMWKASYKKTCELFHAKCAEIAALNDLVSSWRRVADQYAAEIAALTEQRDIVTERLEELVAFAEQRDRVMQVVEAARAVMEWYDRDGSVGGISEPMEDLRAALDAEAAAETAPSLPETP